MKRAKQFTVVCLGLWLGQKSRSDQVDEKGPDVPAEECRDRAREDSGQASGPEVPDPGGYSGQDNHGRGLPYRIPVGFYLLVQLNVQLCGADHTILDTGHGFFPP